MKKAVLIIHGFTDNELKTEELKNYLNNNTPYDAYNFTLPGHEKKIIKGTTHKEWISFSESYVEDLLKDYKTIYVIGHSMGGVIATYLASKYKEIKKVVLVSPSFEYLSFEQNKKDFIKKIKKEKFKDISLYDKLLKKILSVDVSVLKEFTLLVKEYKDLIFYIKQPVLFLHGDEDELVPFSASVRTFAQMDNKKKKFITLKEIKHQVFQCYKKDDVNYIIKMFLSSNVFYKIKLKIIHEI